MHADHEGAVSTRWKAVETQALLDAIGSFGWSAITRRTRHTKPEIWAKVLREYGGGGITRGSYSLAEAMEETGYARTQLERASEALNQRWQRTARGGNYLITAEQLEDLAAWLQHDFWCPRHHLYHCENCKSAERPHRSLGLCSPCYSRVRRYARSQWKISLDTDTLLDRIQNVVALSGTDSLFLETLRTRLRAGRCPSIVDLRRAFEWICMKP